VCVPPTPTSAVDSRRIVRENGSFVIARVRPRFVISATRGDQQLPSPQRIQSGAGCVPTWTSADAGATWRNRPKGTAASGLDWQAVASDATVQKIANGPGRGIVLDNPLPEPREVLLSGRCWRRGSYP
jgi:hypothetical protein